MPRPSRSNSRVIRRASILYELVSAGSLKFCSELILLYLVSLVRLRGREVGEEVPSETNRFLAIAIAILAES